MDIPEHNSLFTQQIKGYWNQFIVIKLMDRQDKINQVSDNTISNINVQSSIPPLSSQLLQQSASGINGEQSSNSNCIRNIESESSEVDLVNKKAATAKLRFRKLKQRLSNMCYRHQDISTGKEVTSTNKPRIMKLSIELQKQVNNQMKDYNTIEVLMKELLKILEQKRENDSYNKRQNDLHILRQSKCIPSLMEFCKKILSLYRNQFRECFRLIEIINRILQIFCTMACNRQYLIMTNRVPTLSSLLVILIKREEATDLYLISNLYNIITSLLDHKLEGQYGSLIPQTTQYLYQCSLVKKTISIFETLAEDGSFSSDHLVKSGLRFLVSVLQHTDSLSLHRPINQIQSSNQSMSCLSNIESIISFFNDYSDYFIPDKDSIERTLLDGDLPVCSISFMLLVTQAMYFCCKLSLSSVQKIINDQVIGMLAFMLRYSKQYCEQSEDLRQLLNKLIVLIGYLAFDNTNIQNKINQHHIISDLCNLPTKFVVDKKSIQILVPTLCCLVNNNQKNTKSVFQDLSTMHVKKFLKTQLKLSNEQKTIGSTPGLLTRKSSLSSMTSTNTQCSSIIWGSQKDHSINSLRMRFPVNYWMSLYDQLDLLQ